MSELDPAVYRKAAATIRGGGLAKRVFRDNWGGHCTVGALMKAHGTGFTYNARAQEEADLLVELLGDGEGAVAIFRWNDALERTAEDVITLLEQAAEKLEADQ